MKVDGETAYYQVFIPAGVQATAPTRLPVILFLHGSGERGGDGVKQTHAGLGPHLRRHAADFPALAVFPRCRATRNGAGATTALRWPPWTPPSPSSVPIAHGST